MHGVALKAVATFAVVAYDFPVCSALMFVLVMVHLHMCFLPCMARNCAICTFQGLDGLSTAFQQLIAASKPACHLQNLSTLSVQVNESDFRA